VSPYRKLVKLILSHDSNLPITPLRKAKNEVKVESKFDVHVTVHCVKFLIIKPTRCTNFSNLFLEWNYTFRTVPLSIIRNFFFTVHAAMLYPSWSCSQAVSKPVWHIPLLRVQWKTPDGGQRNCPKRVENKFEKLVHLVGFSIRKVESKVVLLHEPHAMKDLRPSTTHF